MAVSIQWPPNLRGLAAPIAVVGFITAMMLASAGALAETSPEQVTPGAALYETHCSGCHSLTLRGSAHGAPLSGSDFTERWGTTGPVALMQYNQARMPPGTSGTLSGSEHSAVVAFLFDQNKLTLDANDLLAAEPTSADTESWSGAAAVDALARSKSGFKNRTITDFEPVTEKQLANPPPLQVG